MSKKEKANRSKFGMAQYWLKPILDFVRQGFKGYSPTVEGFVAAKSWLLKNAFEGTGATLSINPALVKVSHGELPLSGNITAEKNGTDELLFSWDTEPVEGGSPYDQVMMLAYDPKHEVAYSNITGQFRNTGSDTLKIHKTPGRTYHLYLAFTAADRTSQSDSVYLGTMTS
ncbi:DUF6266 family protein [Paraflavitalea speifideaquila]|uniref:DUF6266 family protein n=1 Tax=Paraflavitalea speifideaquila TaxID=3076558 RepID=UPI0028ECD864|nr:DUF6266 family protein [Paraflavitalea speifideiaquila]